MQNEIAHVSLPIADRMSRAQGRKARRHSATAKLTRDEHEQLEKAAKAEGKALSEWCRDALLAAVRSEAVTPTFTEIVAIRQLLNSALRHVACGEVMTPTAFQEELQSIRTSKHRAAGEVMQQYAMKEEKR